MEQFYVSVCCCWVCYGKARGKFSVERARRKKENSGFK